MLRFILAVSLLALFGGSSRPVAAADPQIARGKYLVTITGCSDCHTPGFFFGKPDTNRFLGGSDVGFAMPGGVFVGPNLTPDKETGLGNWTTEEIIVAITKGRAARQACARADHAIKQPFKPDALRCAGNRCLPAEPAARVAQGARALRPERDAKRVCHVRAARRGLRKAAKAAAIDAARNEVRPLARFL